jgi:Delta14-sterol reductase
MLAFSTCLLALGLSTGYILRFGVESFTFFYDHWVGLTSAALSMSLFQGILWYALSFQEGKLLALGGNSGSFIYDVCSLVMPLISTYMPQKFYIGRELNPTVGSLDIKSFNELRPGMILWLLIDISMACAQATRLGGHITDSMILVLFFQGLYIMDALYNEVSHLARLYFHLSLTTPSSPQSSQLLTSSLTDLALCLPLAIYSGCLSCIRFRHVILPSDPRS